MPRRYIDGEGPFGVKFVVNGFQKAGTHLAARMVAAVVPPLPPTAYFERAWVGTHEGDSWSDKWVSMTKILFKMGRLHHGHFLMGHCAYSQQIDAFMWYSGISHVFVYRDLRDCAVSQAHHILSQDDTQFLHPAKDRYWALGGFDEVLEAVIVGLDEFPGIVARWELYAPWLAVPFTHSVGFEDLIRHPQAMAAGMLEYGLMRAPTVFGLEMHIDRDSFTGRVKEMVASGLNTAKSPTFRRGRIGDWRSEFTDKHERLFNEAGGNAWLQKLGYV